MARSFDPREVPDGGRSFHLALDLCAALALVDGPTPRCWRRCRGAALRYVEALRAGRVRAGVALRMLREAVATWAPPELEGALGARLARGVPFWVGTVYGLRWQPEPDPVTARPLRGAYAAAAAGGWHPAPPPGQWSEMRTWRRALAAQRERDAAHRRALQEQAGERQLVTRELVTAAVARMRASERVASASRGRLAARPAAEPRAWSTLPAQRPPVAGGPRPAARLTDAEILHLARRIQRAVRSRRPDDPRDDILSRHHELPPDEEARVEAALEALQGAPDAADDRRTDAERPQPDGPTRERTEDDRTD